MSIAEQLAVKTEEVKLEGIEPLTVVGLKGADVLELANGAGLDAAEAIRRSVRTADGELAFASREEVLEIQMGAFNKLTDVVTRLNGLRAEDAQAAGKD